MQSHALSIDAPLLDRMLTEIGEEFALRKEWVEIAIYGGAALLLHFSDRDSTRDIDYVAISGNDSEIKSVATMVGARHGMEPEWFNDAVRISIHERREEPLHSIYPRFATEGGMRVFAASPRYILAMKLNIMRSSLESHDVEDIWNLLGHCEMKTFEEAEKLVKEFFPDIELSQRNKAILQDVLDARAAGQEYDPMIGW